MAVARRRRQRRPDRRLGGPAAGGQAGGEGAGRRAHGVRFMRIAPGSRAAGISPGSGVMGGVHQAVELRRIGQLDLKNQPALQRIGVGRRRPSRSASLISTIARQRGRRRPGRGLDRLDHASDIALGEGGADGHKVDEHHVTERVLVTVMPTIAAAVSVASIHRESGWGYQMLMRGSWSASRRMRMVNSFVRMKWRAEVGRHGRQRALQPRKYR